MDGAATAWESVTAIFATGIWTPAGINAHFPIDSIWLYVAWISLWRGLAHTSSGNFVLSFFSRFQSAGSSVSSSNPELGSIKTMFDLSNSKQTGSAWRWTVNFLWNWLIILRRWRCVSGWKPPVTTFSTAVHKHTWNKTDTIGQCFKYVCTSVAITDDTFTPFVGHWD